jgi:hypothetical protein
MVAGASAHAAHDGGCSLSGAGNEARDVCIITGPFAKQEIELHYGSLSTEALIVEVVRAPVTVHKFIALATELKVEIQSENGIDGFVELLPIVKKDRLVYSLDDLHLAPTFITMVRISVRNPEVAYSLQTLVHQIFGREAFALVLNKPRGEQE